MPIDWNKPLQTSHPSPHSVECIRKNLRLINSTGTRVVVAKWPEDGTECLYAVHEDGSTAFHGDEWRVVNVPETFTLWVNVYHRKNENGVAGHETAEQANRFNSGRIALYRMRFSESGILEQTERVQ